MARKRRLPPFGASLRRARLAAGFSQRQLERLLGLSETAIGNYENGGREPKLARLVEFADALKITLDELVGRTKG